LIKQAFALVLCALVKGLLTALGDRQRMTRCRRIFWNKLGPEQRTCEPSLRTAANLLTEDSVRRIFFVSFVATLFLTIAAGDYHPSPLAPAFQSDFDPAMRLAAA
jgi:hypothetical protein